MVKRDSCSFFKETTEIGNTHVAVICYITESNIIHEILLDEQEDFVNC